jgi:hypothetical protein
VVVIYRAECPACGQPALWYQTISDVGAHCRYDIEGCACKRSTRATA